jgi:hypothetical protein
VALCVLCGYSLFLTTTAALGGGFHFCAVQANQLAVFNIAVENRVEKRESIFVTGLLKATSTFCTEFCARTFAVILMAVRRTA